MRTRRLAAFAAAAMFLLGTGGCSEETPSAGGSGGAGQNRVFEAGTTMRKLSDAKKVRVGTKYDQPGFGLKQPDGTVAGFDVEIAKIIAAELGIGQIEWTETPSAVREQVIEQDRVDFVVATYTINDARKQRVGFAGPYYLAGQHIMVRADEAAITGPESLKANSRKRVCTVINSTSATNIRKYLANNRQLVTVGTYQNCVDELAGKRVDAVTTDNVILLGFIANNEGKYKLAGNKFTDEPYGIGVKKDDTGFRNWINNVLEKAFRDGRYEKAWRDTVGRFDSNLPTPPNVNRY